MAFSQFYLPVRAHFSSNHAEYDKFKEAKGMKGKVEFLLAHPVVVSALQRLQESITEGPKFSKTSATDASDGNFMVALPGVLKGLPSVAGKPTKQYPQMSDKVEVRYSKARGRHLVAKQRIEPGRSIHPAYIF